MEGSDVEGRAGTGWHGGPMMARKKPGKPGHSGLAIAGPLLKKPDMLCSS